jgi:hypothetical protein
MENKPKAFISSKTSARSHLETMLLTNEELYNKSISTPGFSYGFSQLANRAIHFDYLYRIGIIPKDYLEEEEK